MDPPPSTSGRGSRLLSKSPPALRVLIADENQQRIAERGLLAPDEAFAETLPPDEAFAEIRSRARNPNQTVFDVPKSVTVSYPW